MKIAFKVFLIFIVSVIIFAGISLATGWFDIFYTKTVGKEKQNVERQVFEQTQSYVEGKRQEAAKLYKEYKQAETEQDREAIEIYVLNSFINFDEDKLKEPLRTFIYNCKYD